MTHRVSQKVRTHFNRLWLKHWITYESFFHINKVKIKCHYFENYGKTVDLIFNGLTGVNSLCLISGQEIIKKVRFVCPYKKIVYPLRMINQYQSLINHAINEGNFLSLFQIYSFDSFWVILLLKVEWIASFMQFKPTSMMEFI